MGPAKLQQLACELGLEECISRTSQTELVRTIQAARGDEPCFCTGKRYDCGETCEWCRDCRKQKAVWLC
ncbi:MAG: hypothetical protein A3F73_06260 [Gallionellales bacterium RIFCSPLOWO2_12_FULL_59_22]|nr:MAG: hypothetical protein A3H99_02340 [Gallionellales bacterium RIFCSPLOWO2_02_FULL_59_110]OGT01893.1 MAG: hypothetical protein A2Z65_10505 [Gallionellales bacterium RIFCSPLOWO2_02_58_13]OGT10653.1 MAG: hypothetical protein A3F73_06260 [Gallionellales bacterium RIFCSPLOWO2_12_FULL_59_22]